MTCDALRERLLELPVSRFDELKPHLDHCADCRALAERVVAAEAAIDRDLDDFVSDDGFDAAWTRAIHPSSTHERRRPVSQLILSALTVFAAAAALLLAVVPPGGPDPEPAADLSVCGDPEKLQARADIGALSPDAVRCLEDQTDGGDREAASRLLIVNDYSRGDSESWERRVLRHMQAVDDTDPDLALKLALHASRANRHLDTMRWADHALAHRDGWGAMAQPSRIATALKLRAVAAQGLWQQAELAHTARPSPATRQERDRLREQTRDFARAWLDHAVARELPAADEARRLCAAAAGRPCD